MCDDFETIVDDPLISEVRHELQRRASQDVDDSSDRHRDNRRMSELSDISDSRTLSDIQAEYETTISAKTDTSGS